MDGSVIETLSPTANDGVQITFDLHEMIAMLRRRFRLIVFIAVIVLGAVAAYTFTVTPEYTATANVMIDMRKKDVVNISAVMSGLPEDSSAVDTEVQVLKSRSLAEKVVNDQKLYLDPEFNRALRPPNKVKEFIKKLLGRPPAPPSQELTQARREAIVDNVLKHLTVTRRSLTYLIDVSFDSKNPATAARLANAFAHRYLLEQLEAKFDATQQANGWLNTKVAELRQQVAAAETAVQQFKVSNNLLSAQGATLTEQEISTLRLQAATAEAELANQEATLNAARQQIAKAGTAGAGADIGDALKSDVIVRLRDKRAQASQTVADLQGRYGERHPDLLKAKRELADMDAQIQAEINRIISNQEAQVTAARARAAAAESSVSRAKGTLVANNQASVRLNELERNAEAARALYESFLNRFKETSAQEGLETSDARVLSEAKTPTQPSSPNLKLYLAAGLVLALATGGGVALLAEALDNGLATAEDVERKLGLTYLGSIPSLQSTLSSKPLFKSKIPPIDFVVEKPLSSFSEAFRNLRAAVLFSRTAGESVKVVAMTSSLPEEGKTTTSLALARTIALAGSSVIILDCDLRKRGISRFLSGEPTNGLIEVLNGSAVLEQALVRDGASGAMILPLARSAYTAKDVFRTPAMRRLLDNLRRRFDVVVLDTAPVLPVADTRILAAMADTVVVLTRWRKTPLKAVESTLRILRSTTANIAGAALTQVDLKAQAKGGYGDPGYYYGSYKKYYAE